MALPKLNSPTYQLELPSTGKKIKFRPFLVKEQKILMMAQESKEESEILNAMTALVSDCTFGKIDATNSPMFDMVLPLMISGFLLIFGIIILIIGIILTILELKKFLENKKNY